MTSTLRTQIPGRTKQPLLHIGHLYDDAKVYRHRRRHGPGQSRILDMTLLQLPRTSCQRTRAASPPRRREFHNPGNVSVRSSRQNHQGLTQYPPMIERQTY